MRPFDSLTIRLLCSMRNRRMITVAASLLLAACAKAPVVWADKTEMEEQHPSPLAFPGFTPVDTTLSDTANAAQFARTQDLLREAGAQSMLEAVLARMPAVSDSLPPAVGVAVVPGASAMNHGSMSMPGMPPVPGDDLGNGEAPSDSARCARSLRVADAPGGGRVAVWWSRRSSGRVWLVAARQPANSGAGDGAAAWRGPLAVDTLDQGAGDANAVERGAVGCDRAAPGLAVDARNGYVHVAYALNAPEGPGVFYAHQMDPRAAFEIPVVMMYGDRRMGAARVATSGDVVAVVFEDPNAPLARGRIGLALSYSSGHVFESRVSASRSGRAVDPFVLVRGRAIAVGWTDNDPAVSATSGFRLRRGTIR